MLKRPLPEKNVIFCQVVRVDMREMLTMAAGERAANYDGLQVHMGRLSMPFLSYFRGFSLW